MLDMSVGEIRHALTVSLASDNNLLFESQKRVIKALGGYEREDFARMSPKERKLLIKCYVQMFEDIVLDEKIAKDAIDNTLQEKLVL